MKQEKQNIDKNNKVYINWDKKDNSGKRDRRDTRLDEVEKMVNYITNIIPQESKIWCPFGTNKSNIVITLKKV